MSIRQSVAEWATAIVIATPLIALYIVGERSVGWVRYVCLSAFALSIIAGCVYAFHLYKHLWDDEDDL